MDNEVLITLVSALLAALSFVVFALPFLKKTEKKERYRNVIEKRRKALFDAHRDGSMHRVKDKSVSAADSIAALYKMQQMAGEMGEKVRSKMLQAGIRNPSAPIKFMIAQGVLPIILCGFVMLIISNSEKEISNVMTLLFCLWR